MGYISHGHGEFKSLLDYVLYIIDSGAVAPCFNDCEDFRELVKLGLLEEHMILRTSNMGLIDQHYYFVDEKTLRGIPEGPYPGEKGEFTPEEILSGERISSGWTIESPMALRVLLRRREDSEEEEL